MAKFGSSRMLEGIDNRLRDPGCRTPSMSFIDEEIKSYSDLFKADKGFNLKSWEPVSPNPSSMPLRPQGE